MDENISSTPTIDFDHPLIREFTAKTIGTSSDSQTRAIRLYDAVRDSIRYDPYSIDLTVDGLKASTTLKKGRGWCVAKAILLAACCRSLNIPARLGFADVRNHLSTERMREQMKTDVFYWHGFTTIFLDGKWVKATPAFNIELCRKFNLKPLEFDGKNDSIYHPFDLDGHQHMEYLNDRGTYADVPIDEIISTFQKEYLTDKVPEDLDFDKDVEKETTANK
jgi:transglutaminase-like putative cysteine protease